LLIGPKRPFRAFTLVNISCRLGLSNINNIHGSHKHYMIFRHVYRNICTGLYLIGNARAFAYTITIIKKLAVEETEFVSFKNHKQYVVNQTKLT